MNTCICCECTGCYDSDGTCHQINKACILNCYKCIYRNDSCIIQCEPILCSNNSNNCDRMVPTNDGCCMTCASSEGTFSYFIVY